MSTEEDKRLSSLNTNPNPNPNPNPNIKQLPIIDIEWPCDMVVPSRRCENRVIQVLHRRGEWGRGRDLPQQRQNEIQKACDGNHMTLYQALSLRRTMLRSFPGGKKKVGQSNQMGTQRGQQQVAQLFEDALATFIGKTFVSHGVQDGFLTEPEILGKMKIGELRRGPTPDLLFTRPVRINGQLIKWMDAKLFYASVTYAGRKDLPNGKLWKIAKRYNEFYGGKGAFVFGQGFCVQLQDFSSDALLLDATPLDMSSVMDFQNNEKKK